MGDFSLATFLALAGAFDGEAPEPDLVDQSNTFLAEFHQQALHRSELHTALTHLPYRALAWVAGLLGHWVEAGGDASYAFPILWRRFMEMTSLCDPSAPRSVDPNDLEIGLTGVSRALVSHLAALPREREHLALEEGLLERLQSLEGEHIGVCWVAEAIRRCSGDLLLIHPGSKKAFRARYENVGNCFHLFSLLQTSIGKRLPGGRESNPSVSAAIKGEANTVVEDSAWWHYGNPNSPNPSILASIWGEASVRSIPKIEGYQVVLLWDSILGGRSWDSGFFGPHLMALPATVRLEGPLPYEECVPWFERLGLLGKERVSMPDQGAPKDRPWWRFW